MMKKANLMNFLKANLIEAIVYSLLFLGVGYSVYVSLDKNSFDSACALSCGNARSLTPVIDFRNQCLCEVGRGKWEIKNVRTN